MRGFAAALAALLAAAGASPAAAQSQPTVITPAPDAPNDNATAVPPAPPIVAAPAPPPAPQTPATPAPPGLVTVQPPAGDSDANTDNGAAAADQTPAPAPPPAPDAIPAPPNDWQPGRFAELGVLDKIAGGARQILVPVGGSSVVGDLQVAVLACVSRPSGEIPDAAVFLALQDPGNPGAPPQYRGWLLRSAPGAAIAGDASEVFRIIDCG